MSGLLNRPLRALRRAMAGRPETPDRETPATDAELLKLVRELAGRLVSERYNILLAEREDDLLDFIQRESLPIEEIG